MVPENGTRNCSIVSVVTNYHRSTRIYTGALVTWSILGFSGTEFIPGMIAALVGAALAALAFLSHFKPVYMPTAVLSLSALALASPLWTGDTGGTPAALGFGVITVAAAITATYVPLHRAIVIMSPTFKVVLVLSLALMVIAPQIAVESRWPNEGALTGIYVHKNILGSVMLLGLLTHLFASRQTRQPAMTLLWVGGYLLAILLTRSSTALVLAAVVLIYFFAVRRWRQLDRRRQHLRLTGITILGVVISPLLFVNFNNILASIGRDDTLSGRDRLWTGAIAAWRDETTLGHGWGTAFREGDRAAHIIQSHMGWVVPHAHNGYLSVLVQLGVVGLALAAMASLALITRAARRALDTGSDEHLWALAVAFLFIANNMIDDRFGGLPWFLAVAVIVWCRPQRAVIDTTSRRVNASAT